jgi:glycosyltransferase involved in cell wall biosynthesis
VLVLCRNERNFIEACLDSIVAQDFPPERLEVLVVDGMSTDGTREIIDRYARTYPRIRRIDNLHLFIPFAYNAGIKNSSGDPIMIMSAHATYENSYVRRCVEALEKYDADNVVGVWKIQPRVPTWKARAIVRAMSDPFGVGNALYRTGLCREPTWVDTGAYGCIRRRVFDDVGLYNEKLLRGEDMEFSYRLRQKGYKTLLVPEAVVHYLARTDFVPFVRHNFLNGAWAIIPFRYTTTLPVAWRHLVPLTFVAGLLGTALAAAIFPRLWPAPAAVLGAYVLAALAASVRIAVRERNVLPALPMPFVFASLHLSYGLGSLWGLAKSVFSRDFWKNLREIVKNR